MPEANFDEIVNQLSQAVARQTPAHKPSLGRIVIHRGVHGNGSYEHPAIINRVWSSECVNLTVFPDCGSPTPSMSQLYIDDPANTANDGWYWPPRV